MIYQPDMTPEERQKDEIEGRKLFEEGIQSIKRRSLAAGFVQIAAAGFKNNPEGLLVFLRNNSAGKEAKALQERPADHSFEQEADSMKKNISIVLIGILIMLSVSGCGKQTYKLNYDGSGFESRKTEYAAGEKVTVYYDLIATDTDYTFSIDDDVEMQQSYDDKHGCVLTFRMPEHDVTLHEQSHESMIYVPPLADTDAGIKGISIMQDDITDFYYTYDWVGYNALYQRYRFYVEDGEYLFYHETRQIEDDYGWASEADITSSGTVTLSVYEWDEFLTYLSEGSAAEPEESDEAGDSGPWMYLYYRSGNADVRKEYHFASVDRRLAFEEFCQSLTG